MPTSRRMFHTGPLVLLIAALLGCEDGQAAKAPEADEKAAAGVSEPAAKPIAEIEQAAAEPVKAETPAETAAAAKRGRAAAVHATQGPAVDGTMKDATWLKSPKWPMGPCTSDEKPKYDTFARLLLDDANMYVGVFCAEPNTDQVVAMVTERDGDVWQDDSVEIFVKPNADGPYHQFVVNTKGALLDVRCADPRSRSVEWNSTAEVKASVDAGKSWTVTLRIPLKDMGAFVGDGQSWAMNIYRTRPAQGGDPAQEYAWAVMNTNDYHSPMDFGVVEGVNVPKREDGVTAERSAPAPKPKTFDKGEDTGGVVVYRKISFDEGMEGFGPSGQAKVALTDDAVSGKALRCDCEGKWTGPALSFDISGSKDLRMAFHAKPQNWERCTLNVHDQRANDNTTSYAYRFMPEGQWTPVLYYLDRFRYNSSATGFVGAATAYTGVRFYCGEPQEGKTISLALDNFVLYRGADTQPPAKVTGLKAKATKDGVELTWDPAQDNVAPMVYVVSRAEGDGPFIKVGECYQTYWTEDRLQGGREYSYRVLACDFEENVGAWSEVVKVKSLFTSPQVIVGVDPELTQEEKDRPGYAGHVLEVHKKGEGKVRKNHVCCYGDSLTAATVYPQAVMSALGNLTVAAHGFAGQWTSFGKKHVEEILDRENPEFMLVLFGTNNLRTDRKATGKNFPEWMEDMEAIAKAGEARGTVVLFGEVPPAYFDDPESKPEAKYNEALAETARRIKVPMAYIFRDIQAAGDRRTFISGDGIHWTGEGMEVGGKAWAKAMAQVRWLLRDRP